MALTKSFPFNALVECNDIGYITDENNPILGIIQKASEFITDKTTVINQGIKERIKNSQDAEPVPSQEPTPVDNQIQTITHEPENTHPVAAFLAYLQDKKNSENTENSDIAWLRIQRGLFICIDTLQDFLKAQAEWHDNTHFMDAIQPYLISENEHTDFRYRPKAFEDRRILEGIIIQEEHLDEAWKQQPINTEFQPAAKL